jgi:hypothetical protein
MRSGPDLLPDEIVYEFTPGVYLPDVSLRHAAQSVVQVVSVTESHVGHRIGADSTRK